MERYKDYKLGDTVYTVTEERTPKQPLVMECVVEEILGDSIYKVYDVTQNRMHVRHASQLISLEDMEYSVSEWIKIKINKDGNK